MNEEVMDVDLDSVENFALLRLRVNDESFAHIEVRPCSGEGVVLQIIQIMGDNSRKAVKWIPNIPIN